MIAVGLVTVPEPAWRRRAGLALGWAAVAVPAVFSWVRPDPPVILFLAALNAACALARGWELGREATPPGWRARVFHTTTLFDSRIATRAPREVRWRDGLAAAAFAGLGAAG